MRRLLLLAALVAGGVGTAGNARAEDHRFGPHATSVTWPSVTPPGWYTNTYKHAWYYPWYAYYNFSHGPYANWMAGGGYAGYANHGPAGMYYSHKPPTEPYYGAWYTGEGALPALSPPASETAVPKMMPPPKKDETPNDKGGKVSVTLPADAKLLFNGVAASGSGSVRTFQTPPLAAGQSYKYELTAEVVRDGRTDRVTETVIVRAGETATVTLTPPAVTAAGAK